MSTAARLATRHACINRNVAGSGYHHTEGNGVPKRKRCAYCGGGIITARGLWGAFAWRGDGRYPLEAAIRTFTTEARAEVFVLGTELVTRWIPA